MPSLPVISVGESLRIWGEAYVMLEGAAWPLGTCAAEPTSPHPTPPPLHAAAHLFVHLKSFTAACVRLKILDWRGAGEHETPKSDGGDSDKLLLCLIFQLKKKSDESKQ